MSAPSPVTNFPAGILSAGIPVFGASDLVTMGRAIWVDGTYGNDSYDGYTPSTAKLTIAGANSAATAGAGDIVLIKPGTYTWTAALSPTEGTLFRAALIRPYPTVTIEAAIATFITLEKNFVVFDGIQFKATADAVNTMFLIADTVDVYGFGLYRCLFNANGKASVIAVKAVDATYGLKYSHIIGNTFGLGFDTGPISIGVLGMAGSKINYNTIGVADGLTGISLADTGAITVGAMAEIAFNLFVGNDVSPDDLAITIAGTENTTALVAIHDNRSVYCAANSATQDKISSALVNNYGGDAATGGTLWDPGT